MNYPFRIKYKLFLEQYGLEMKQSVSDFKTYLKWVINDRHEIKW